MSIGQTIKKMAIEAVNSGGLLQFAEGEIVKNPPDIKLKLKNNPKLLIPRKFIRISEHLTKHKRLIDISSVAIEETMSSEGSGPHTHNIQSLSMKEAEIEFLDELKVGDKVMVAVIQGGQSFFILDRFKEG